MPHIKSWEVSDELWVKVEPLIPLPQRPKRRKPIPPRKVFGAIVYVLRTGCPWKALPKEFGSASAIHKHFQQWHRAGFFLALWRTGLAEEDEMEGIAWDWQSLDGALGKAPLITECGGANVHDVKLLPATLDQVVSARPAPSLKKPQRLGADVGCPESLVRREAERHPWRAPDSTG